MQLGIPAQLAPILFAQALSRLFLVYSAYSVIFAEILIILAGWHENNAWVMWAGFLVGFPGFVLWRLMFTPLSPLSASFYIVFLSATLVIASWAILATIPAVESTQFLPFTLLGFALVTTCGVAARARDRILWASIGFVAANISLFAGATLANKLFVFDSRLLLGFVVVLGAVIATPALLKSNTKLQITFDQSAEEIATEAERLENTRAVAARLHDTLLANLAVIGSTKPGMLQDPVREAIETQMALFETSSVGRKTETVSESTSKIELEKLMSIIAQSEARGLSINLGGNPAVVEELTSERVNALTSALAQCLNNVLLHSGQNAVEVVVLPAGENIAVTIIDGGQGFDVDDVPDDRMGLKLSVRDRIERSGGSVRIWSNHGQGTAVMLQLPLGKEGADA